MVHCSRRRTLGTLLALAMLIALTALFVFIGTARADEASAASSSSASVVREEVAKRTQYAATYLMSDGTHRTIIYQAPIHFRNENGEWQPVNRSLLPVDGIDTYATAATPVAVMFADEAPGQKPVTVTSEGWTVTMNLEGCAEDDKLILGDSALYLGVAPDTDVTYTVLGDGVKEVITLASAKAPNEFSYRLSHPGLALRRDAADQGWALFAPGKREPVFYIGAMNVSDSSRDEIDEPAWCESAKMTVSPGEDASTLIFSVPRTWLDDPARVYPVKIDPDIGSDATKDTYLAEDLPTQSFGSQYYLFCGRMASSEGKCRTLVRFPQVSTAIGAGRHITSSTFQLYEYWQPATHTDTVYVDKLRSDSVAWQDASTYNSANSQLYTDYSIGSQPVTAGNWLSLGCQSAVQSWLDGQNNRGFIVYEPDSAGSGWSRKFRSVNYTSSSAWPKLIVESETPSASTSGAPTSAHVGDTLNVTVTGSCATASEITSLQLGINRQAGVASRYRGYVGWFASGTQQSGWSAPVPVTSGTGYYAYTTASGDNNSAITLLTCTHTAANAATFSFRINDAWSTLGDVQDTSFDARLDMSSGSHASWYSGWFGGGQAMDLLVSAIPGTVGATPAPVATDDPWFVGDQPNNDPVKARSKIDFSWTRAPGAAGYKVLLATGTTYQEVAYFDSTAAGLSWTTQGKGLFPSGSALRGLLTGADAWKNVPQGYSGNPFKDLGTGLELRDNPNELYNRINPAGTGALQDSKYHFAIVPWNGSGAWLPGAQWSFKDIQLPGRSVSAQEVQHTTADLGSWDGHSLAARLDEGKLTTSVTDLAVASLGPQAAMTRTYISDATTSRFAPGWFFSFDQNLDLSQVNGSPNSVTYTDENNVKHIFYRGNVNCPWEAPNGFFASLTGGVTEGAWKLTFNDQRVLTFDLTGRLTKEAPSIYDDGLSTNLVTYAWSTDALTITAANGQTIAVAFSGGKVTSASHATSAGTRTVAYSTAAPWQVTYNAADSATARTVKYAYDASGWLSEIAQDAWPASGQSAVLRVVNGGTPVRVTEVDYPDMFTTDAAHAVEKSDARATIAYDSATQATVTRYGTVTDGNGVTQSNQPMKQTAYTWEAATDDAAVAGRTVSAAETTASGTATTSYAYAENQLVEGATTEQGGAVLAQSSAGVDDDVISGKDNVNDETVVAEKSGQQTSKAQHTDYWYDDQHRVTKQITYRTYVPGPPEVKSNPTTTLYTYDARGNVSDEQVRDGTETGTIIAETQSTYDASNRLTLEKHWVSGSAWTESDYSNFAPNGEPQTTVAKALQLSYGGASQDLTRSATYDDFGNLLTATDWGGRTTETNAYDLAGRKLTSTDASGVVTHTVYDRLGSAVEAYRTAPGTSMKSGWSEATYDAMGRALTVTTKLSDGSGNPTVESVVTNAYDGAGDQLTSSDSTVGGEDEKWLYDVQGNVTRHWSMGASAYDEARATRTKYDAQNQVTGESQPGNGVQAGLAGSSVTAYNLAGQVASEARPDGSSTTFAYDDEGNQTLAESSVTGTLSSTYGADARLAAQTNESNFATSSAYDGLGRTIGATGSGQSQSQTTYNHLGWVLRTTDANGVTTSKAYDAHGVVTDEAVGTAGTTHATYDALGRLLTRTDPNGDVLTCTYDEFGNLDEEKHQDWNAATLKDVVTSYDSLGRPLTETEAVSGRWHTWEYPENTAAGIEEEIGYDAVPAPFTFGNTTAETGSYYGWVDEKIAGKFTLAQAASVPKLTGRISNNDSGHEICHLKAIIYADSGGSPGALLATGTEVAIADNAVVAWVDLPFASAVNLSAGDYWLGVIADSGGDGFDLKAAATGGSAVRNSDAYADGPADPFGSASPASWKWAIYATCEGGSASTNTELHRNPRGMETSRTTTVASGVTLSRAVADTSGRDQADRWTSASLQLTGYGLLTLGRSFDDAGRASSQSGAGFSSAGSYSYNATSGLRSNQTLPLALGGTVSDSYTYSAAGRLRTWGPATYDFDDAGNLTGDGTTTFTYDGGSNRLTSSVSGGATTVYGWDEENAWRTSQGPSGDPDQIQYTYTRQGEATSNGRMTGYSKGSASSITEVGSATATGSGTAVSITPGVAVQEGDVVLAVIHANESGNAISDDNGASAFTTDVQEDGPDTSRYAIVHRLAGEGEPATYAWTLQSSQSWSAQVRVFRGVDASVWDVAPSAATRAGGTSGTVATAPSMTVTAPGALGLLVCLTDTSGGTSYSAPSNGYAAPLTPGATMLQSSWTKTWAGAGATGESSATLSASNDWVAHQVALRPAGGTSASYVYDAAGQRTRSTVSASSTTTTTDFTYDGLTLLKLTATQDSSSWRIDYLYDEEGAGYGGVYRSPASSASAVYFTMITNDHGDVLELLDAAGDAFASYRYDPWGSPIAAGTTTASTGLISGDLADDIAERQVLRYASYAYDAESGLYYCSARYYDPTTQQWTTGDLAKADGEESAYQYCGGDPVGRVDASGLWAEHYIFGIDSHGFSVYMRWPYRSKWYCRAFTADLIWHKRSHWWQWSYKGMGQHRIEVELYAHAVAYYSAAVLNRLGIRSDAVAELRRHASPAYVNNNERLWMVPIFYTVWDWVPG